MDGGRVRSYFAALCILSAAVAISPEPAQAQARPVCDSDSANASAVASIVQATGDSLQRKRWQPQGGVIQFTIKSFSAIPDKASFLSAIDGGPSRKTRKNSTRPAPTGSIATMTARLGP